MLYEVITSSRYEPSNWVGLPYMVVTGVATRSATHIFLNNPHRISLKPELTSLREKLGLFLNCVITSYSIHYTKLYECYAQTSRDNFFKFMIKRVSFKRKRWIHFMTNYNYFMLQLFIYINKIRML